MLNGLLVAIATRPLFVKKALLFAAKRADLAGDHLKKRLFEAHPEIPEFGKLVDEAIDATVWTTAMLAMDSPKAREEAKISRRLAALAALDLVEGHLDEFLQWWDLPFVSGKLEDYIDARVSRVIMSNIPAIRKWVGENL